jgi:hypothetical protein
MKTLKLSMYENRKEILENETAWDQMAEILRAPTR